MLLLRAAFADPHSAALAWEQWYAQREFEQDPIHPATYALLPFVYDTLQGAVASFSSQGRLKGIFQKTWLQSQLAMESARPVLDALETHQISFSLLDDLYFVADPHSRLTRPPTTLSILIAYVDLDAVLHTLNELAIVPLVNRPERFVRVASQLKLSAGAGLPVQLNWRPFPSSTWHPPEDVLQRAELPAALGGRTVTRVCAEVQFVRSAVEAIWGREESAGRAMVDVLWMLSQGSIDIDRASQIAAQHGLITPLRAALADAGQILQRDLDVQQLRELDTPRDRFVHRLMRRPRRGVPGRLRRIVGRYLLAPPFQVRIPRLRFLQYYWGGNRLLDLPRLFLRHILWPGRGR